MFSARSVIIENRHIRLGPNICPISSITDVSLDDAGTKICVWPIVAALILGSLGLGLFWETVDPVAWLIGTGLLLAGAALCLSSRKFIYRLMVTDTDGAKRAALSSDHWELDLLKRSIEQGISQNGVVRDSEKNGQEATPSFHFPT